MGSRFLCLVLCLGSFMLPAQQIGTFTSVSQNYQSETLVLPASHNFQLLWQSGLKLDDSTSLAENLDFTSYVPINGSSLNGYTTVSSELNPARVAIFSMQFDPRSMEWKYANSGNVDFGGMGNVANFCSGGVMPWGTIVVAEENIAPGDANSDGYEDNGWIIEIDPATKSIVRQDSTGGNGKDKAWALGRTTHENLCVAPDRKTFYFGADNPTNGFLYKFISQKEGSLASGSLFVLKKKNFLPETSEGTWVLVPNNSKEFRNNTHVIAATLMATNFNGVEDVEVGPDGLIYFTAKGPGRVYRFKDNHTVGLTNDVEFEIFVENKPYDIDGNPITPPEPWGIGNDNLAFDGEGNLWVLQDGDKNHIWVVGPKHKPGGDNDIRLFATTPKGSEPTGINFTPDYKYMFISFQHPDAANQSKQIDALGDTVIFNKSTTVVIARTENLGAGVRIVFQSLPQNWKIIPNPVESIIHLDPGTEFKEPILVKVLDDLGKIVIEQRLDGKNAYKVLVSELKSGSYQLIITGKNINSTARFLKK